MAAKTVLDPREAAKATIREQLLAVQKAYNATIAALNKAALLIDPTFEPVIVGQAFRAAGLLIWDVGDDGIVQVLLAKETDGLVIPGGKAVGEEHPELTSIREFDQEIRGYYEVKTLEALVGRVHSGYLYYAPGKYSLFIVHARTLGTPLKPLPLVPWTAVSTLPLHPFAKLILGLPAIQAWACTARFKV